MNKFVLFHGYLLGAQQMVMFRSNLDCDYERCDINSPDEGDLLTTFSSSSLLVVMPQDSVQYALREFSGEATEHSAGSWSRTADWEWGQQRYAIISQSKGSAQSQSGRGPLAETVSHEPAFRSCYLFLSHTLTVVD